MLRVVLWVSIWEQEGRAALALTLKGSVMLLKHFSSWLQALCISLSSSQPTANMLCQRGRSEQQHPVQREHFQLCTEEPQAGLCPLLTQVMAGPAGSVMGSYISRSFLLTSALMGCSRGNPSRTTSACFTCSPGDRNSSRIS